MAGGSTIWASNFGLLFEVGAIFSNYRFMFTKEELNVIKPWYTVANDFIFVLSFTVFRVALSPLILYMGFRGICMTWNFKPWWRLVGECYVIFQFVLICFLNYYWYVKMIKGVIRILKGKPAEEEGKESSQSIKTELIDKSEKN